MRDTQLPPDVRCYKQIGPFRGDEIPKGLLSEHRLKEGVWGLVTVCDGTLDFVWDDGSGDAHHLVAPTQIVVPPTVPHHLEHTEAAEISIAFHAIETSR